MAMRYINHCRLDDRIIRTDWDAGFVEGRQFGRGRSGGQVKFYSSQRLWFFVPKIHCYYYRYSVPVEVYFDIIFICIVYSALCLLAANSKAPCLI